VTAVGRGPFVFVLGFNRTNVTIKLGSRAFRDVHSGRIVKGKLRLSRYGVAVLQSIAKSEAASAPRRARRLPKQSPAQRP